uniref:Uncharacterized protein n=1 Tax=Anguilla anguilla TaxID=7936 RepID=A0A0E9T9A4_ANGAN
MLTDKSKEWLKAAVHFQNKKAQSSITWRRGRLCHLERLQYRR